MSWHGTPLEDAPSFGANRRDSQRALARTVLSGALVLVCVATVPALISFSERNSGSQQGLDLAVRDSKLSGKGKVHHPAATKSSAASDHSNDKDLPKSVKAVAAKHGTLKSSAALHKALVRVLSKHDSKAKAPAQHDAVEPATSRARSKAAAAANAATKPTATGGDHTKSEVSAASVEKGVEHHDHQAAAKAKVPAEKKRRGAEEGSTAWEREQDDDFFDSLDKQRARQEETHKSKYLQQTVKEDKRWGQSVQAEHAKVEREYEDAKKRFAAQRMAAKKYTQQTFAAMEHKRSDIEQDSETGFKSIEAKELATEVERDHPNESAQQIAQRAMKLLKVVMHGGASLPAVPTGPGPMR